MSFYDKDLRLIRKKFESKNDRLPEQIRLGNHFVDDFILGDSEAADIPINALRVIFNIIIIIANEQFRPEDRPRQLSLFDEEFETDNNVFACIKIRNNKISPSGSTKQVIDAYEFLTKFKMGWYKSTNSKGREIKTFGGLISSPSYDERGYTTFLISSYWLKKLLVIPEYNYILYNLVYNIRNNKHVIFAIWLAKIPDHGTTVRLSTLNKRFGLNYKSANDFCFKFLKPAKTSLHNFNNLSFNFKYSNDLISIIPYQIRLPADHTRVVEDSVKQSDITNRLRYLRKRYNLLEQEIQQFEYQYKMIPQTREMIEKAFSEFKRTSRAGKEKTTDYEGIKFLYKIQELIIMLYRGTKMGKLLPNGYPVIM